MNRETLLSLVLGIFLASSISLAKSASQASAASPAQEPAATAQTHAHDLENDAALNLTQDQNDKIKSIRDDAKKQMQAIKSDTSLSPDDQQAKMRQLRKETHAQIFNVLTPEQRKTLAAEMNQRRAGNEGHGEKAPDSAPPQQ